MKYFVHLKDDVVFAWHQSETDVDVPGDNIVEVPSEPESYLTKKYVNGQFLDPQQIKYAKLDSSNTVVGIEKTFFSSDIKDGIIINNDEVQILWKWNGSSFESPNGVQPVALVVAEEVVAPAVPESLEDTQARELDQALQTLNQE